MTRSGLLAALLLGGVPAFAQPGTLISLDARIDAPRHVETGPDRSFAPLPPGLAITWEGFLDPDAIAPARDLCALLKNGRSIGGAGISDDPAEVLDKLVDHGLCDGETG